MSLKKGKYAAALRLLYKSTPRVRKELIKTASPGLIRDICTCVGRLLRGQIPVSAGAKRKLRKKKNLLRKLAKSSTSLSKKRNIIQRGGLLPFILPLISAIAGPAIRSIIGGL